MNKTEATGKVTVSIRIVHKNGTIEEITDIDKLDVRVRSDDDGSTNNK
jgi:hypothetical protein